MLPKINIIIYKLIIIKLKYIGGKLMSIKKVNYNHYFIEALNNFKTSCRNPTNQNVFLAQKPYLLLDSERLDQIFQILHNNILRDLAEFNTLHNQHLNLQHLSTSSDVQNIVHQNVHNLLSNIKLILVPEDGYKITLSRAPGIDAFDLRAIWSYDNARKVNTLKNYHILNGVDLSSTTSSYWIFTLRSFII